jgi:hypothetical protein
MGLGVRTDQRKNQLLRLRRRRFEGKSSPWTTASQTPLEVGSPNPFSSNTCWTSFKGFCAQEFFPKRPDAIASLKQGVEICDV